ncbi:MAG: hypothetical protein V3T23_03905 [Nitrososphaerales archaeon]
MKSKYHIVAIDNDYGHIAGVTLYSSHNTKEEAEGALNIIEQAKLQSYLDQDNREKENRQRYLKWASKAIIECPNEYGGLNWTQHPGDPNHTANAEVVPQYTVAKHNNKTTISCNHIRIKGSEPLVLLQELAIPPEHYLEYHLVDIK